MPASGAISVSPHVLPGISSPVLPVPLLLVTYFDLKKNLRLSLSLFWFTFQKSRTRLLRGQYSWDLILSKISSNSVIITRRVGAGAACTDVKRRLHWPTGTWFPTFANHLTIGCWPESEEVGGLEQRPVWGILKSSQRLPHEQFALTFFVRQVYWRKFPPFLFDYLFFNAHVYSGFHSSWVKFENV